MSIPLKWSLGIKITFAQKFFLWQHFLRCHMPLVSWWPTRKVDIKSVFSNIIVWLSFFKYNCVIVWHWKDNLIYFQKHITNRVWKCTQKAPEKNVWGSLSLIFCLYRYNQLRFLEIFLDIELLLNIKYLIL